MGLGHVTRNLLKMGSKINNKVKGIDGPYEKFIPLASYAPWNSDEAFLDVFNVIQGNTLVDNIQCHGLWKLVEESAKTTGALIEVGVWRGGTGALIAKKAELCGIRDRVYLCDTFRGVVKAGTKDNDYKGGEHSDTSTDIVKTLVHDTLQLNNVDILEGIFPEESLHRIQEDRIRFVHIDVDVYESAKDIVDALWDRISPGGIIAFDDYGFSVCNGITDYVNEQRAFPDRIVIHNLNGHGIIIKR